jgi:hypothetical protein
LRETERCDEIDAVISARPEGKKRRNKKRKNSGAFSEPIRSSRDGSRVEIAVPARKQLVKA